MKKLLIFVLLLALAPSMYGQTATPRTALSSAVTTTNGTTFFVVSTSGITVPTAFAPIFGYIDEEQVQITSVNTTNNSVTVIRGQGGTRAATHLSGAPFWSGPPSSNNAGVFVASDPQGSCTRGVYAYLPLINPQTGNIWDCILSTTATTANWTAVNLQGHGTARPYKKLALSATTYTLLPTDEIVGYNTNVNGTITIPALTGFVGKTYLLQIEVTGTQSLAVATSSGQTINGASSITIGGSTSFSGLLIYGDGTNWFAARAH